MWAAGSTARRGLRHGSSCRRRRHTKQTHALLLQRSARCRTQTSRRTSRSATSSSCGVTVVQSMGETPLAGVEHCARHTRPSCRHVTRHSALHRRAQCGAQLVLRRGLKCCEARPSLSKPFPSRPALGVEHLATRTGVLAASPHQLSARGRAASPSPAGGACKGAAAVSAARPSAPGRQHGGAGAEAE